MQNSKPKQKGVNLPGSLIHTELSLLKCYKQKQDREKAKLPVGLCPPGLLTSPNRAQCVEHTQPTAWNAERRHRFHFTPLHIRRLPAPPASALTPVDPITPAFLPGGCPLTTGAGRVEDRETHSLPLPTPFSFCTLLLHVCALHNLSSHGMAPPRGHQLS